MLRKCTIGLVLAAVGVVGFNAWKDSGAAQDQPVTIKEVVPTPEPRTPLLVEAPDLPVSKVVLFNSGVGYFQREGEVEGTLTADLRFPAEDINDLIKSMVLEDLDGGTVLPLRYDSPEPVAQTLQSFALDLSFNPSFSQLLNQARGEQVEVTLQANGTLPAQMTGVIVGMEVRPSPDGQIECLNLMAPEGLRNIPVTLLQRVRFLNPQLEDELRRALEVVSQSHDAQKKSVRLGFHGEGKRRVRVGYVIDNPIWKSSYRIVLDANGQPRLQAWATIENVTDEDWNDIDVVLVSGRPISFRMDLYDPLFVPRPTVEPELFASLRPPTYNAPLTGANQLGIQGGAAPGFNTGFNFGAGFQGGFGGGGFNFGGGFGGIPGTTGTPGPAGPGMPMGGTAGGFGPGAPMQDSNIASPSSRGRLSFEEWKQRQQGGSVGLPPVSGEAAKDVGSAIAKIDPDVLQAATASRLGFAGRFAIKQKLDLPRQQSAMIQLFDLPIEADLLTIYNESVQAVHPLLGLKFTNPADQALMQGPITVYEGGEYAGDARIQDVQAGEERLISYAVDLATEVKKEARQEAGPTILARVVNNTLELQFTMRETTKYLIRNRSQQDRKVVIEHPFRSDWKLVEPEKPDETSRDVYRFGVTVKAGESTEFEVAEEQPRRQSFQQVITPTKIGFPTGLGIDVELDRTSLVPEEICIEWDNGQFFVKEHDRTRERYYVRNRNDEKRTVILEHVFPEGRRFVSSDRDAMRKSGRFQRYELKIEPDKTESIEVVHELSTARRTEVAGRQSKPDPFDTAPDENPPLRYRTNFALDVTLRADVSKPRITGATIDKGVLSLTRVTTRSTDYEIQNRADEPRRVTLEHVIPNGWIYQGEAKPVSATKDRYRFTWDLATHAMREHRIQDSTTVKQSQPITELSDIEIEEITLSEALPARIKTAIKDVIKFKEELAQTTKTLSEAKDAKANILTEQDRIRTNIKELPADATLYKRYLEKFDQAETELEAVEKRIEEQSAKMDAQTKALSEFLEGLSVE